MQRFLSVPPCQMDQRLVEVMLRLKQLEVLEAEGFEFTHGKLFGERPQPVNKLFLRLLDQEMVLLKQQAVVRC